MVRPGDYQEWDDAQALIRYTHLEASRMRISDPSRQQGQHGQFSRYRQSRVKQGHPREELSSDEYTKVMSKRQKQEQASLNAAQAKQRGASAPASPARRGGGGGGGSGAPVPVPQEFTKHDGTKGLYCPPAGLKPPHECAFFGSTCKLTTEMSNSLRADWICTICRSGRHPKELCHVRLGAIKSPAHGGRGSSGRGRGAGRGSHGGRGAGAGTGYSGEYHG
jgi:hypothetical protein